MIQMKFSNNNFTKWSTSISTFYTSNATWDSDIVKTLTCEVPSSTPAYPLPSSPYLSSWNFPPSTPALPLPHPSSPYLCHHGTFLLVCLPCAPPPHCLLICAITSWNFPSSTPALPHHLLTCAIMDLSSSMLALPPPLSLYLVHKETFLPACLPCPSPIISLPVSSSNFPSSMPALPLPHRLFTCAIMELSFQHTCLAPHHLQQLTHSHTRGVTMWVHDLQTCSSYLIIVSVNKDTGWKLMHLSSVHTCTQTHQQTPNQLFHLSIVHTSTQTQGCNTST